MRLLYACSDFGIDPAGTKGASIHLRAITRALADLGHSVTLLSPKDGPGAGHPATRLLPPGCPPADECGKLLKSWMTPRGFGDALAKELRPLLYNAWALPRAQAALAESPVDAIVERLSLMGHVGADLADSLDVPLILEVNALLSEEARQFRALERVELAEAIEQRVLERADAIVAVSAALADRIAQRGIDARKIHVVPNGVDVDLFAAAPPRDAARRELGLPAGFIAGFVGSLKPWHGADVLIDAFAQMAGTAGPHAAPARLLIVGAGPQESALREQAQRAGILPLVLFTGAVPHERVPLYIRAMDAAVAPYRPLDGFYFSPLKLFEYMAARTCVVASRIGQIEDVIEHERSGLLCEPGDAAGLARLLSELRNDPARCERQTQAAFDVVRTRFTWQHAAQQVEHVIRSVATVSANRPPAATEVELAR